MNELHHLHVDLGFVLERIPSLGSWLAVRNECKM
jgi:hypothetical protein